jgi:4-hydroxy-tetrahydrodipicolinate reductase
VLGLPAPDGLRVGADARKALHAGEVLIEFTSPEATVEHARLAQELGKPMVIGTTGLSQAQQDALRSVSKAIPILVSPNMSLGVNVLFELAALAAKRLGSAYDVEVVESHHRHKKDAPSGTAKRLAAVLAEARGCSTDQIPVHAVRAGDIVGDHTVLLAGGSERLELTHRAHSREVFAQRALRASQFIVKQPPGFYDMGDVLKAHST